jgi:hypothetical protein
VRVRREAEVTARCFIYIGSYHVCVSSSVLFQRVTSILCLPFTADKLHVSDSLCTGQNIRLVLRKVPVNDVGSARGCESRGLERKIFQMDIPAVQPHPQVIALD